jgi:hypothetical protein
MLCSILEDFHQLLQIPTQLGNKVNVGIFENLMSSYHKGGY